MSAIVLPSRSRFAKAARGWPSSPNVKPHNSAFDYSSALGSEAGPDGMYFALDGGYKSLTPRDDYLTQESGVGFSASDRGLALNFTSTTGADISRNLVARDVGTVSIVYRAAPGAPLWSSIVAPEVISRRSATKIQVFGTVITTGVEIADGNWHTITALSSDGTSLERRAVIDGVLYSGTVSTGGIYDWSLGNYQDTYVGHQFELLDFYASANRHSVEWAQRRHRDIFEFLEPANQAPFLISVPSGGGTPTLSSPTVTGVTTNSATPQVTVTF